MEPKSAKPAQPAKAPAIAPPTAPELHLPVLVFGTVELHRLLRELDVLEDYMQQETIRKNQAKNGSGAMLPRVSRLLDATASENQRNLLRREDREVLRVFLNQLLQTAPTIHVSFASDPSSAFTAKLVAWLRSNIHPFTLLQIGLQPSIAAGCVVRTTNQVFDLSLRQRFADQKANLIAVLQTRQNQDVPQGTLQAAPQGAAA